MPGLMGPKANKGQSNKFEGKGFQKEGNTFNFHYIQSELCIKVLIIIESGFEEYALSSSETMPLYLPIQNDAFSTEMLQIERVGPKYHTAHTEGGSSTLRSIDFSTRLLRREALLVLQRSCGLSPQ